MASRPALPIDKLRDGQDTQCNLTVPRRTRMPPGRLAADGTGRNGRPWSALTVGCYPREVSAAAFLAGVSMSCAPAAAQLHTGKCRSKGPPGKCYLRSPGIARFERGTSEIQRLLLARGRVDSL
jgi:hypothetical protein